MHGPTVIVTRGDYVESRHHVAYAMVSADETILGSAGDIEEPMFMRSAAKPLVCAAIVASGAADRFQFTQQEIAIIAGSHSGEPYHVKTVLSILQKIGLDEIALGCGAHPPLHAPSALALAAASEEPRAVHNNCSGKHAGILALAIYRGHTIRNYLSPDHPVQVEILDACAELLCVPVQGLRVAVDGCGMPALAVSLRAGATFYARLGEPATFGDRWHLALSRVSHAMLAQPEYVGGTGRFDTDLMMSASPTIICKSGAEGYQATSILTKNAGMALKVLDGSYRAVPPFVVNTLLSEGVLFNHQAARLELYRRPTIVNHSHDTVGHICISNAA